VRLARPYVCKTSRLSLKTKQLSPACLGGGGCCFAALGPFTKRELKTKENDHMGTRLQSLTRCLTSKQILLFAVALFVAVLVATPASAQTCLNDIYKAQTGHKVNCTANDVSVANVTNVRDLNGNPLTTCFQGTTFSFLADFEIVTTSSSFRSNVGLYFANQGQASALTGSCVDNIISPLHQCPGAASGVQCGSDNYKAGSFGTCGDTSSNDSSPVFGTSAQGVTVVVTNFLCQAPAGSSTLQMPNCTSWQEPGGSFTCNSSSPDFPFQTSAIPGAPSKCNCGVLPLPITPVTVTPTVAKACTTGLTSGLNTTCDAGAEGSTVTYTVSITNTSNVAGNNVVVDQICDDQYGNVFTASGFTPACPSGKIGNIASNQTCPPNPIAPGATGSCTFTVVQGELKSVTDIASASGHSSINPSSVFLASKSNSVTVTSSDAPSTATLTKGLAGTIAGCATVRYNVTVHNSSGADEALTLSGLGDTAYGTDITKLGSGAPLTVLGTTCGVATGSPGLGTLSTSTGAGILPTVLAVGGTDYTCQFDGQFCSALDAQGCISHSNKLTSTLAGDEGEAVTVTGNTLTVKECFNASATSTTP
jgi:hypothetical protein